MKLLLCPFHASLCTPHPHPGSRGLRAGAMSLFIPCSCTMSCVDLLMNCSLNQHALILGAQHIPDSMLGTVYTVGNKSDLVPSTDALASPDPQRSRLHTRDRCDKQLRLCHRHNTQSQQDVRQRECPPRRPPPGAGLRG